ncbi:DNA-binding protein [Notoacmeibacter marinus]|uniref:DNA-binding protein n=1 Tax=Notoacmeibacter marinus TaxID=1876515 RepID=A0A231V0W9_9HYPH|nr:RNA-binding protein [Notoacmeibacter marinus]OXT01838.1 DNA-binding protein [Notoacmeibacter marinus]
MATRTCIVTRAKAERGNALLRFVAGPDGSLVPDLKASLPGRGCWVRAERRYIEEAVKRRAFSRALKTDVAVPPDLADRVDRLLAERALGALGLARKSGRAVIGAAKVDAKIRSGEAACVLHATDGAQDGLRKVEQAATATRHLGGPDIPVYRLFDAEQLGLALGAGSVIHAAVLGHPAGQAAFERVLALALYRQGPAEHEGTADEAAMKDTE